MPPNSERICLVFLGMDMLVRAATMSAIGLTQEKKIVCPRKSPSVAPSLALVGGSLRLCFRRRLKRERFGDMGSGVGIEDFGVIKRDGVAIEVFDYLVDDLDEPAGRGIATLGHDESIEESGGSAEGGKWYGVLVDGYLVERRHKEEQENMRPFPIKSRTLSTRATGI